MKRVPATQRYHADEQGGYRRVCTANVHCHFTEFWLKLRRKVLRFKQGGLKAASGARWKPTNRFQSAAIGPPGLRKQAGCLRFGTVQ